MEKEIMVGNNTQVVQMGFRNPIILREFGDCMLLSGIGLGWNNWPKTGIKLLYIFYQYQLK